MNLRERSHQGQSMEIEQGADLNPLSRVSPWQYPFAFLNLGLLGEQGWGQSPQRHQVKGKQVRDV